MILFAIWVQLFFAHIENAVIRELMYLRYVVPPSCMTCSTSARLPLEMLAT